MAELACDTSELKDAQRTLKGLNPFATKEERALASRLALPSVGEPMTNWRKGFAPDQIEQARTHVRLSAARGLPRLEKETGKAGPFILVGGGPSATKELWRIRSLAKREDARIICLNDTHNWLISEGIVPWGVLFFEVGEWQPELFTQPHPDVNYLLAAWCHPTAFDRLDGYKITVWHPSEQIFENPADKKVINEGWPGAFMIPGGSLASTRSLSIGWVMGYTDYHLFGLDSSFEGQTHAYYDRDDADQPTYHINCGGKEFQSKPYLIHQAQQFQRIMDIHKQPDNLDPRRLTFYGTGMLPYVAQKMGYHVKNKRR